MSDESDTVTQNAPTKLEAQSSGDTGKSRARSHSQDTLDTVPIDVANSESSSENDHHDEHSERSEDEFDADARISSKSLTSYASSSTKPKSFNSTISQQSSTSSSTSKDEIAPSSEDIRRVREQLQNSLQEEKSLLSMQQKLLGELEEIEHSIIEAKMDERLDLVASQQAHIAGLLTRGDIAV